MANAPQTYANHAKFVPMFHYFAFPVLLGNVLVHGYDVVRGPNLATVWGLLVAVALMISLFVARLFALGAQDRVIRLEERLRMRELLPADLQGRIPEITREQIIGLRFASDEELPALVAQVLRDNIQKRDAVKKLVKHWRADHHQL